MYGVEDRRALRHRRTQEMEETFYHVTDTVITFTCCDMETHRLHEFYSNPDRTHHRTAGRRCRTDSVRPGRATDSGG